jgi:hypothetical protein
MAGQDGGAGEENEEVEVAETGEEGGDICSGGSTAHLR